MLDTIQEIYASINRNKLRTALTGFSVAWGIFMLIVLLGAGNGLIHGITNNMGDFLANSMMVFGGQTSKPHNGLKEGRNITLNDGDISTTRQRFGANVEVSVPRYSSRASPFPWARTTSAPPSAASIPMRPSSTRFTYSPGVSSTTSTSPSSARCSW